MGVHQKGSHFPICVFTNNVGRRSPQKLEERRQTQMQSQWRGSQWWPARQMQRQGSQERPPLRARPQQGSQSDSDPQQGRQFRTRSDVLAVAEERPAVAYVLENAPDALARWRMGRRGEREHGASQASGDTWSQFIWCQAWGVTGAQEWAAVADTGLRWSWSVSI